MKATSKLSELEFIVTRHFDTQTYKAESAEAPKKPFYLTVAGHDSHNI
jgi:hypothetical protein